MNLKVTINLRKIDKSAIYDGKNGKYATFLLWQNRDGDDQYGNSHSCKQDLGPDRKTEQAPFVGNAKTLGGGKSQPSPAHSQGRQQPRDNGGSDADMDDVPFAPRHSFEF